ncbi:MAG: hypothetical protein WAT12_02670 [Candidatus Nitrotoga sp.]
MTNPRGHKTVPTLGYMARDYGRVRGVCTTAGVPETVHPKVAAGSISVSGQPDRVPAELLQDEAPDDVKFSIVADVCDPVLKAKFPAPVGTYSLLDWAE